MVYEPFNARKRGSAFYSSYPRGSDNHPSLGVITLAISRLKIVGPTEIKSTTFYTVAVVFDNTHFANVSLTYSVSSLTSSRWVVSRKKHVN